MYTSDGNDILGHILQKMVTVLRGGGGYLLVTRKPGESYRIKGGGGVPFSYTQARWELPY